MTAETAALAYAARGLPVLPCHSQGDRRKRPLIDGGFHAATTDEAQIRKWLARWPDALIGVPTGRAIGAVVLDIDVKSDRANGYDTLDALGFAILPNVPMVHTATGGLHLYFAAPEKIDVRNTAGHRGRGIGAGVDWRGEGGYVIVPSPGSGYSWDPHWNLKTTPLAEIPDALLPREPERSASAELVKPTSGLAPYAEKALDDACRNIIKAPAGEQEARANGEAFSIGTLAGAGAIPVDFARRTLVWAARQMPSHNPRRPWRAREIEAKVVRAFDQGMQRPRGARRA